MQPRKFSEQKIYAHTGMSEKWGLPHRNQEKSGLINLLLKKGGGEALKNGAIRHAHPYYAMYRK